MILVSSLGDFHSSILPIFFNFKHKIKTHILIYDDSNHDIKRLNKILIGQKHFLNHCDDSSINFNIIPIKIDEDSYDNIISAYQSIINYANNDMSNIFFNATDGLGSISIIMSSKLLKIGANVIIYDRYANTYNLHTKNNMIKCAINKNIDIKNHLKLMGYNVLSYSDKRILQNRKDDIMKLSLDLAKLKSFAQIYPDDSIKYNYLNSSLGNIEIEDKRKKSFLLGTIFEEYIYWLLVDNFNFDEVMTGVEVEFGDNHKNEFDILMIKDNHLHTIECKFVNSINGEHFVYKSNSIIDYLDDDGRAMILSIGGDNERITAHGNKKIQFSKGDFARAENGNIIVHQSKIFDKSKFLNDVSYYFKIKLNGYN